MPPRKSPAMSREASPTSALTTSSAKHSQSAQQTLALWPLAEVILPAVALPKRKSRQLWLCIYLPALPLEALLDMQADARVVVEEQQGIPKVLQACQVACAAGITPGMTLNAALALLPGLRLLQREPAREQLVLRQLAQWAGRYTSFVCLDTTPILLLEVAGSLRLFGGIRRLRRRLTRELRQQGYTTHLALAPTPLAATWLAWAGRDVCIEDEHQLHSELSTLPLACLDWPVAVCESLRGMGITRLGDCLRLPRHGFAKRFGSERLLQLDRAIGRLPDPRAAHRAIEKFSLDYDLPTELGDSKLLLNVCALLLQDLQQFLTSRQIAVQRVLFNFLHLDIPATSVVLGGVQVAHTAEHWLELLRIKLEQLEFPAAVISISLRSGQSQALVVNSAVLPFVESSEPGSDAAVRQLVERLAARIGHYSVRGISAVAEHRPQYAWRSFYSTGSQTQQCAAAPGYWHCNEPIPSLQRGTSLVLRRPLWLLSEPRRLPVQQEQPVYDGCLRLLDGPERLETGWWDDDGIARDYYTALSSRGIHLWIYQDQGADRHWYLHGIFG